MYMTSALKRVQGFLLLSAENTPDWDFMVTFEI
jgi:hypothetical protein